MPAPDLSSTLLGRSRQLAVEGVCISPHRSLKGAPDLQHGSVRAKSNLPDASKTHEKDGNMTTETGMLDCKPALPRNRQRSFKLSEHQPGK